MTDPMGEIRGLSSGRKNKFLECGLVGYLEQVFMFFTLIVGLNLF